MNAKRRARIVLTLLFRGIPQTGIISEFLACFSAVSCLYPNSCICQPYFLYIYHFVFTLQNYYKNLEYTRIFLKKSNLFGVFYKKPCYWHNCADVISGECTAGGVRNYYKCLQLFLTYASSRTLFFIFFHTLAWRYLHISKNYCTFARKIVQIESL